MRGDRVVVRVLGDRAEVRVVWDEAPHGVYVVPDDLYKRLRAGMETPPLAGIPMEDVFVYDDLAAQEARKARPTWERLTPYH